MKFDDQKYSILDAKLHLFKRPNSPFWWCGFHHKGKYLRTSTKAKNKTDANHFAEEWFFTKQAEIRIGVLEVKKDRSFSDAAKKAISKYEGMVKRGERSASYLKGIRIILDGKLLPYFGDMGLSKINNAAWHEFKAHLLENVNDQLSERSFHQIKNALRIVLNEAEKLEWLDNTPTFKEDYKSRKSKLPRAWFEPDEYEQLYKATRSNITRLKKTRWKNASEELHDYLLFMTNTGLRVGEASNLRFCDIEICEDHNFKIDKKPRKYLLIKNIQGKRGTGECRSYWGAVRPFERTVERRKIENPSISKEPVFLEHHRDMFNKILQETGLKLTNSQPPMKRDFISLRHTYICFRLLAGANIYDVAANCRTSVAMIENHYARWLRPRMNSNINKTSLESFGNED